MTSLRPTSVCDTTPLQRFESTSSSSEEPSSPTVASIIAAANCLKTAATTTTTANAQQPLIAAAAAATGVTTTQTTKVTESTVTTAAATYANNNNNNNNKNTSTKEVTLQLPNYTNNGSNGKVNKMKSHGAVKIIGRIFIDLCILACVGLPMFGFSQWGDPNRRGFFCDDDSLKHPYKKSTIRSWMLYVICLGLPTVLIIFIEFYRGSDKKLQHYKNYTNSDYNLERLPLPNWLIESYKKIGILVFGCFVEQLTTDIAKYSIGRLRPHFFEICQPKLNDGTTCDDAINAQRYIMDYTCSNTEDVSSKVLKDVSLSFPSGHASFTFFTMIYIAIYLQKRMHWQQTKMLKHLLQFMFLMFAWYTSLTRVSDYKHHWTDVLAGAGIGITYGVIATSTLW